MPRSKPVCSTCTYNSHFSTLIFIPTNSFLGLAIFNVYDDKSDENYLHLERGEREEQDERQKKNPSCPCDVAPKG